MEIFHLVKKLWENSFAVKAGHVFNSLPKFVRNHVGGDVNGFKTVLNSYLSVVPNNPRDVGSGSYSLPTDPNKHTKSNSLIHWRTYLEKKFPKYRWNWAEIHSSKSENPYTILRKYEIRKAREEQLADRAVGGAELEPGSLAVSLTGPLARERLNTAQYTQHSLTLRDPY